MELDLDEHKWEFGVLPFKIEASSDGWTVDTLESASLDWREWSSWVDSNDWVHPPIQTTMDHEGNELRHLRRSSLLWRLPATHRLTREDREPGRASEAVFLIYSLGLFFGIELQLADWLVTGRVSARPSTIYKPNPGNPSEATSKALCAFSRWFQNAQERQRRAITSACYLHNLVPTYEWDWEAFAWQHAVFEAIYGLGISNRDREQWKKAHGLTRPIPYEQRPALLARKYGLAVDESRFERWSRLRNPIVHETLWAGTVPGHVPTALDPNEVDDAWYSLRNFCTASTLGMLGYPSSRLSHDWWSFAPVFI